MQTTLQLHIPFFKFDRKQDNRQATQSRCKLMLRVEVIRPGLLVCKPLGLRLRYVQRDQMGGLLL